VENTNLDALDNEIIRLLTEDGRMAIGEMTEKLNVTASARGDAASKYPLNEK